MTAHPEVSANEAAWRRNYDAEVPRTLAPYPDLTLVDYLRQNAAEAPEHPAILFKGARLTYADLERETDRFASALVKLGVKPGDRVSIALPNCPQFMIGEIGIWKIGAIACPLNPTYTERELEDAFNASGAEVAVVLNRLYEKIKSVQA